MLTYDSGTATVYRMTLTIAAYVVIAGAIFGIAFWLKRKSGTSDKPLGVDSAPTGAPTAATGVDPSTETDEYKAVVRENSILRRPDPEENAYSPKGKFLIENVPNDIQSYTVWRMADVLLLGGRKPRGFCFRTRAEADEFCRRKEGGE